MPTLTDVKKRLPFRNWQYLITNNQDDKIIIREILKAHNEYAGDYDQIYQLFYTGDIYSSCANIWKFLKTNLKYNAETVHDQTVRSPYRIIEDGGKLDCKHYSLFIGGVLDAIKRHEGGNWTWCYRFASYNHECVAGHVFVVATDSLGEIWVDPVLDSFNEDKLPTYIKDKTPMALYGLAGTKKVKSVVVPMDKAFTSFLVMLNLGAGVDLMRDYPEITTGPVYQYFKSQGLDYDHFMNILKHAK